MTIKIEKITRGHHIWFIARKNDGTILTEGRLTKFKDIKNFKRFVQDKTYLFGDEFIGKGKVKVGVEVAEIQTKEFIIPDKDLRAFRILSFYKDMTATSGLFPNFNEKNFKDAKNQSLFALALQIVAREKGVLDSSDAEFVESADEEIEEMMANIFADVSFEVIYSIDVEKREEEPIKNA